MNNRSVQFLLLILLYMLISGCSSQRKLTADDPFVESKEDLITISENSQSELIIDCSYYLEDQYDDISNKLSNFIENHVIEFDPDGHQVTTAYKVICGKKGIEIVTAKDLYGKTGNKEVVFIFHGGLVGRRAGMKEALESLLYMWKDTDYWSTHHPIFINWRTGAGDAYVEQTLYIRNGVKEPLFGPITAPYNVLSDLGRGLSEMLSTATLEGNRLYQSIDQKRFNKCNPISDDSVNPPSPTIICPSQDSITQNYPEDSEGAAYILATPVRMVTSPLLNGFGESAWENMVRRTRNLIWREKIGKDCKYDCLEKGGLAVLFDELIQTCPDSRISMIGHSMGTMLITGIIHDYPDLEYTDIVFMGAAVSIREFQNTIKTLLSPHKKRPSLRFYNLSLLPIAEAREFTARGVFPSGSLLEFIDEMFTPTPSRLDKTLGKWSNVREVMSTFPELARPYMTFKVFGLGQGQPIRHGDFNNPEFRFWKENFWRGSVNGNQEAADIKFHASRPVTQPLHSACAEKP